jgi:two-component system, NtrC family, nitrogen regulation response regulator GlnG
VLETRSNGMDVRVVAATRKELANQDLYERLGAIRISLPPLRERPEDIPLLVDRFLQVLGKPVGPLSEGTRALLRDYTWPGNVRELKNVVRQVANLGGESSGPVSSSPQRRTRVDTAAREEASSPAKDALVDAFQKDYVERLLKRNHGNVVYAAKEAGVAHVQLQQLMSKYDLPEG